MTSDSSERRWESKSLRTGEMKDGAVLKMYRILGIAKACFKRTKAIDRWNARKINGRCLPYALGRTFKQCHVLMNAQASKALRIFMR